MAITKLTLRAEQSLIRDAKRIAAERHTSVSAIFARFIKSLTAGERHEKPSLGPVTQKASGSIRLPETQSDRRLLEDALSAKYAPRR